MKKLQFYRSVSRSVCFTTLLAATLISIFSGCENPSSETWEEPVHDYFEKYTNTAAIEKHELGFASVKDNSGSSCIPSDGDKTVTFYLRNPRNYDLDMTFNGPEGCTPILDTEDKTIVRITYPQSILFANEAGGSIGGTITIKEHETQRNFDPYTFRLKCNTTPPSVTGQAVLVSPSNSHHYFVCFYLPTTELSEPSHSTDTHSIIIEGLNGQTFGPGTVTELTALSQSRPSDLAQLTAGGSFSGSASGYTAFYYDTGRTMVEGENLSWNIYLRDSGGLTSRKMTASTIVRPANMTVSGETLLTTNDGENTTILTASVDDGTIASCIWDGNDSNIVSVTPMTNSSATITATGGGETTINITATLLDGRIVNATKTIRVLDVTFDASCPQDFIKGQTDVSLNATKPDFATLSCQSGDEGIATVNASGKVCAVAKGSTSISVTASYGGKAVTKTRDIYVHEVTVSQTQGNRNELFVGSNDTIVYTASVSSPAERIVPSGITYIWQNINSNTVTMTGSGNSRTIKASTTTAGSSTIYCKAQLNDVQTTVMTKSISVYKHAITVTPPTSKNTNNGYSSWTDEATYYALTDLNDTFSLSVTTASSFPTGTNFSWTITDSNNHTKDKSGSSASVKPSEVGTIGTTTTNMVQWTVSCTAALPSGLTSTKTQSFYVYKLTIPSIDIVINSSPSDLRLDSTPSKYFVGSDDKSKTFEFTAEHNGVMPTGVTYKWYVGTRQIGSGISITPSIQTLRNTTSVPTSNETCTVRCEVSLTGCDTKSGSTSITFAKPKTFTGDGITFGETSNSFYQYTTGGGTTWTVAYPSTWEQNLTYGVTNGTLPSGCTITWHFSYIVEELGINVVKDEEGPTFNIKPKEFYGNANFDESTNNGIWYVYYTISAPGYKTVANGSIYVCIQKKAEGWTYTDP